VYFVERTSKISLSLSSVLYRAVRLRFVVSHSRIQRTRFRRRNLRRRMAVTGGTRPGQQTYRRSDDTLSFLAVSHLADCFTGTTDRQRSRKTVSA